jgi:hypothetical protein
MHAVDSSDVQNLAAGAGRKAQGSMGPMAVVVIDEHAQNVLEMRLVEHQEPKRVFFGGAHREICGHSDRF